MKLRQIQFVHAIAKTGSFRAAADLCNATQPTVSNALVQLEQELGGALFTRTTRNVTLTPFGRHMMPLLDTLLSAKDEILLASKAYHNPQEKLLRIGISPLVDMHMVNLITAPFCQTDPSLEVLYKECLLDDLADRIETGAIDLAIVPADIIPEGLNRHRFYSDPLVYIPQHGQEITNDGPLQIAALPPAPIIMTGGGCGLNASLDTLFQSEHATLPCYPGHALSYSVIQEWAWLGLGAGILPQRKLTHPNTSTTPLMRKTGQQAQFDFYWIWRRDVCNITHIAKFIAHIRTVGPKLVEGSTMSAAG